MILITDFVKKMDYKKILYPLSVAIVSIQLSRHALEQYTLEICIAHNFYIGYGNDEK